MMDKKLILKKKIFIGVLASIIMGLLLWYLIQGCIIGQINDFFIHYLACVCLVCVGFIDLALIYGEGNKLSSNKSHESIMVIVGFACIILGILSIPFSYILYSLAN